MILKLLKFLFGRGLRPLHPPTALPHWDRTRGPPFYKCGTTHLSYPRSGPATEVQTVLVQCDDDDGNGSVAEGRHPATGGRHNYKIA